MAGRSEIVETMMAGSTAAEQSSRRDTPSRPRAWGIGLLVGAGLIIGGWILWTQLRYKQAILEIEDHIAKGRYSAACRNLEALLVQNADVNGWLLYQLGFCELARGHIEATEKAWASIEPGTEFSERAIRGRMLLLQNEGKIADAERLVSEAANDQRNDRTSLMVLLVPIMIDLGRQDEATKLIEDRWEDFELAWAGSARPGDQAFAAARRSDHWG